MSVHTIFQKTPGQDSAPHEDQPRFIADERGMIVHATPTLAQKTGLGIAAEGKPLSTLFEFCEPEEVFHAGGMFRSGQNGHYIDTIREGVHSVTLTQKSGETALIRFDRIRMKNGRKFLVGSFEVNGTETDTPDLEQEIAQWLNRSADRQSEAKISAQTEDGELRHFLNMSNDVMAVSGDDGMFLRVNSTFNEVLGYEDAQLRSMSFIDLVYKDDRARIRSCQNSLLHESGHGDMIDFEARVVTSDGDLRAMEWRQKRSNGFIYSVGRDITDIKTQDIALKTQARHLSEAQAIGHIGHWHWTVGQDSVEFSDEIYRIFGVDRESFTPTLDAVNALLHKRDVGRLLQAFQRAIIERNNYDMEFRIQRPSGETRTIRCEGRCELDHDGDVTTLFGIMQDVTERTNHEKQLRQAKDAAERAYAAKSQFLANMSHELRTPLNAIIGFSDMMQRQLLGPIGTERYLDYIAGIRESGEHLLDLISDILDMSKMEAGKYELDLEELNAEKVIRLAVHMINGRAQDAGIQLDVEMGSEAMQIVADRRAVMQILLNLLSNAVKFTGAGGWVKVSCLPKPDHFIIRVQDTGIGIPANKLATVGRPFEQAANHYTREHEGTGLGLAITKELAELHGGALFIESTVGVGTIVTVKMPYNAYTHVKAQRTKR